jgi:hypothetical protein
MEADLSLQRHNTLEDCKCYALKRPEAQTREVNLGHPKQEATCRQIQHFRNMTLRRIA